jgi:hypothetical protein
MSGAGEDEQPLNPRPKMRQKIAANNRFIVGILD